MNILAEKITGAVEPAPKQGEILAFGVPFERTLNGTVVPIDKAGNYVASWDDAAQYFRIKGATSWAGPFVDPERWTPL